MSNNIDISSGKSINPSAFSIKSIKIRRADGNPEFDTEIHNLVTKVVINESIYAPSLTAEISVKDTVNLLGSLPILGSEKILINIESSGIGTEDTKEIVLVFNITDIPAFGRAENRPNIQAYTLSCISTHAYLSSLKQISRSFKENFETEIVRILHDDCKFTGTIYVGKVYPNVSRAKGIITTRTPMQAAEFLRRRSADNLGAPFYLFQTISGNIFYYSINELLDKPTYLTYVDEKGYSTNAQTNESFIERQTRILDIKSELEKSLLKQARSGLYASRNNYLDTSVKTFETNQYSFPLDLNPIVDDKKFSDFKTAFDVYIPTNELAYSTTVNAEDYNTNNIRKKRSHTMRAYAASLKSQTQEIVLNGDLNLNAGRKINLKFPKAVDPQEREASDIEDFDPSLSGDHIVTDVTHRFQNDEYFINAIARKI